MLSRYFDNARLAVDLALSLGAVGTDAATMSNFCKTDTDWTCPGCARTKAKIARLDKNRNLYCAIHLHHDHVLEGILDSLGLNNFVTSDEVIAAARMQARFPDAWLCMDCNMAEGRVKRMCGAPRHFSFSPREIYDFVAPRPNANHSIIKEHLPKILANALPEFEKIIERAEGRLYATCPADLENAIGASYATQGRRL